MQFYGIFFILPYKQSGRWQNVLDTLPTDQNAHIDSSTSSISTATLVGFGLLNYR